MLRHTFCHLPGVGGKSERRLWDAGLTTWEHALAPSASAARRLPAAALHASAQRHADADAGWFAERLPAAEAWRLYADFRDHCAFVDIETTGMYDSDHITTIALYDGRTIRTYVHGENLHDFCRDVQAYRLLVTYNGKTFDVPFLERCLGSTLPRAHVDLRYILAALGHRGGLKACERQLGVSRAGLEEVDGMMAVLLWREYRRRGDARALETLLAYNVQDTVNLEALMAYAYNRKLAALGVPFADGCRLHEPAATANPYRADADTIARVIRANPWLALRGAGAV